MAADIVGHDKPRITYGLYSGGASLEVKGAALEKLRYPAPCLALGTEAGRVAEVAAGCAARLKYPGFPEGPR